MLHTYPYWTPLRVNIRIQTVRTKHVWSKQSVTSTYTWVNYRYVSLCCIWDDFMQKKHDFFRVWAIYVIWLFFFCAPWRHAPKTWTLQNFVRKTHDQLSSPSYKKASSAPQYVLPPQELQRHNIPNSSSACTLRPLIDSFMIYLLNKWERVDLLLIFS